MAKESDSAAGPDSEIFLSESEAATHRELLRLDAQLADFFIAGCKYTRVDGAAAPYMLAHAGRELSRGVINILSGTVDSLSQNVEDGGGAQCGQPKDRNRARIAQALDLIEAHATVKQWFDCVEVFSRSAHYTAKGKDAEAVRGAFERFSELLYARLAPFFEPAAQISRLSELEEPTAADADFATRLLARRQLRRQFFASAKSAKWVPLLAQRGHFDHAPDRQVEEDGSWQMVAWPEGEYLARIASSTPDAVVAQLLRVPTSNTNPIVWAVLVDSALVLDEPHASQLAKRVQSALKDTPPNYIAHRSISLVGHMASRNGRVALSLLRMLLEARGDEARQAQLDRLEKFGELASISTGTTDWTLLRLDTSELQQLFEQAIPILSHHSPTDTFKALAKALDRCLFLLREKDQSSGDWPYSHIWLPHIDGRFDKNDIRAILVNGLSFLAKQVADDGANVVELLEFLDQFDGLIWTRIRWQILSFAGDQCFHLVAQQLKRPEFLDPPFGLGEVSALLRATFSALPERDRSEFAELVAAGPTSDYLERAVKNAKLGSTALGAKNANGDEGLSDAQLGADIKAQWQIRRMRLFHEELPSEFAELARMLSYHPTKPTTEEQLSDEGLPAYGGISSRGHSEGPLTLQEIGEMDPSNLFDFLSTWTEGNAAEFGAEWELTSTLQQFAKNNPDRAVEVLTAGNATALPWGRLVGLIDGIAEDTKSVTPKFWPPLLDSMSEVATSIEAGANHGDATQRTAIDFFKSGLRLLANACKRDRAPTDLFDRIIQFVEKAVFSDLIKDRLSAPTTEWHDVRSNSWNSLAGNAIATLVQVGFWDYRRIRGGDGNGSGRWAGAEPAVSSWIASALNHFLTVATDPHDAPRVAIAYHLDDFRLLAPDWVSENSDLLLKGDGIQVNPAARAMLSSHTSRSTIGLTRAYLQQIAAAATSNPSTSAEGEDSIGTQLAWRGMLGFLWRTWDLKEPDGILEQLFAASSAKEKRHAYWQVFRTLSSEKQADPDFLVRVLQLWEWRLDVLSQTPNLDEAEGLLWLLKAPHLEATKTVELGLRTINLGPFADRLSTTAWERMKTLMEVSPVQAFVLFEKLLEIQLAANFAYVPFQAIEPILRTAMQIRQKNIGERAIVLVHRLGEAGHAEFEVLLPDKQQVASG